MSGITTPKDKVLMRIFSSAFSRFVSKKVIMSGWCAFKYTAPAPCRCISVTTPGLVFDLFPGEMVISAIFLRFPAGSDYIFHDAYRHGCERRGGLLAPHIVSEPSSRWVGSAADCPRRLR